MYVGVCVCVCGCAWGGTWNLWNLNSVHILFFTKLPLSGKSHSAEDALIINRQYCGGISFSHSFSLFVVLTEGSGTALVEDDCYVR